MSRVIQGEIVNPTHYSANFNFRDNLTIQDGTTIQNTATASRAKVGNERDSGPSLSNLTQGISSSITRGLATIDKHLIGRESALAPNSESAWMKSAGAIPVA